MDQSAEEFMLGFLKAYAEMADFDDETLRAIVSRIPVKAFKKGAMLLYQGEPATHCIFVIKGCLRQYRINEDGDEVTSEFYEEGQWVNVFNESIRDRVSKYSVTCAEDCLLVYSESNNKDEMFDLFPGIKDMTSLMLEEKIGEINESIYSFTALSPEERVKALMEQRPSLFNRVPQHQIASYLGIKPESLSRIKKRLDSLT